MYKVLIPFIDTEDSGYAYGVGGTYPREGYVPSADRVNCLSSSENKLHQPIIEKQIETEAETKKKRTKKQTKTGGTTC